MGSKKHLKERINYNYFRIINEIPLSILIWVIKIITNPLKKKGKKRKDYLIINLCLIGDYISSLPAMMSLINSLKEPVDVVVTGGNDRLSKRLRNVRKVYTLRSVFKRGIEGKGKSALGLENKEYKEIIIIRSSWDFFPYLFKTRYDKLQTYTIPFLGYAFSLMFSFVSKKHKPKQFSEAHFDFIYSKKDFSNELLDGIFDIRKKDIGGLGRYEFIKENKGKKKIIIHTGSGWSIKEWENDRWVEVLRRLKRLRDFCFIFIGAHDDEKKAFEYIQKKVGFKIYSAVGKLDLEEVLGLINNSDYFIGIDSGPRHIADILNIPSIALLGPGPQIFLPIRDNTIAINRLNCKCTNLFCYRKETCMEKISVDDVGNAFIKLYKKTQKVSRPKH